MVLENLMQKQRGLLQGNGWYTQTGGTSLYLQSSLGILTTDNEKWFIPRLICPEIG